MNTWEGRWKTFRGFKNIDLARRLCSAGFYNNEDEKSIICGFCHIEVKNVKENIDPEKLHEFISPRCPLNMVSLNKRLKTFDCNWKSKISKTAVANSGFFKTNNDPEDDEVTCFSCGLTMAAWEGNEDPHLEHKKARPDCKYSPPEKERDDDDQSCCVCMNEQKNVVFVPCGHVSTCVECANKIQSSCPVCNENFERKIKIYW